MSNTKTKKTQPKKTQSNQTQPKKTQSNQTQPKKTQSKKAIEEKRKTAPAKNNEKEKIVTKPEEEKTISKSEKDISKMEKQTEMFKNNKEESEGKQVVIKIINIILWILLFIWMGICLYDFFRLKQEKNPAFCIKEEIIQYEDGTVETCLGLGYRTYEYKRDSYKGYEFGPFWAKDKSDKESD